MTKMISKNSISNLTILRGPPAKKHIHTLISESSGDHGRDFQFDPRFLDFWGGISRKLGRIDNEIWVIQL